MLHQPYAISNLPKRATFFQPLKFHLEPPDLFTKFCFLRLLLPLLALAIAGEDARPAFQQLPFPGPFHVRTNRHVHSMTGWDLLTFQPAHPTVGAPLEGALVFATLVDPSCPSLEQRKAFFAPLRGSKGCVYNEVPRRTSRTELQTFGSC